MHEDPPLVHFSSALVACEVSAGTAWTAAQRPSWFMFLATRKYPTVYIPSNLLCTSTSTSIDHTCVAVATRAWLFFLLRFSSVRSRFPPSRHSQGPVCSRNGESTTSTPTFPHASASSIRQQAHRHCCCTAVRQPQVADLLAGYHVHNVDVRSELYMRTPNTTTAVLERNTSTYRYFRELQAHQLRRRLLRHPVPTPPRAHLLPPYPLSSAALARRRNHVLPRSRQVDVSPDVSPLLPPTAHRQSGGSLSPESFAAPAVGGVTGEAGSRNEKRGGSARKGSEQSREAACGRHCRGGQ